MGARRDANIRRKMQRGWRDGRPKVGHRVKKHFPNNPNQTQKSTSSSRVSAPIFTNLNTNQF